MTRLTIARSEATKLHHAYARGQLRNRAVVRAAILLGALGFGGCKGPKCENEAFFGLPSPDGASIAFVFHRKCAETKDITTDVTVLDFHSPLRNEPGNVLAVGSEQPVRV